MSRLVPLVLVLLSSPIGRAADPPTPVTLEVDLSDLGRRLVHTKVSFSGTPGPLTLNYPRWVPGTHSPIGPVSEQVGLRVKAGGKTLDWKRDDVDTHAYRTAVPEGAETVEVEFDLLLQPPGAGRGLGSALTDATPKLAVLNWNEVLVYPKGDDVMKRPFHPTVILPTGWKYGTALGTEKADGNRVAFKPVGMEELVDSPLICGEHVKEIPLGPKHRIVLACDSEAGLKVPDETQAAWKRLVLETGKLFGTRHYRTYTFLLALSNHVANFGLEHHESSDNRLPELGLTTPAVKIFSAILLPHEFTHSWNGKFRRPADMITADFQQPEKTRLLWVYEGLTNYYGEVLATRCGLRTDEEARDALALTADQMAASRGRAWRPLDDTAAANFTILPAPRGWSAYRRSLDYYPEGTLIWLEADVLIRTKTEGKKSLDDFCRLFHGGAGGKPEVKGYTFDDLTKALNQVVEYDWAGHLTRRVSRPTESPPLDGITGAGWKLTYSEKPTPASEAAEGFAKALNLGSSVGLFMAGGKVVDVVPDSPATKAGLAPGVTIVAVNGRDYTDALFKEAVAATKTGGKLELLTKSGDFYKTITVAYDGGLRYPRLERGSGPDVLGEILKPLAPPPAKK
jgi:predicted metalloprotease with PDZ domain